MMKPSISFVLVFICVTLLILECDGRNIDKKSKHKNQHNTKVESHGEERKIQRNRNINIEDVFRNCQNIGKYYIYTKSIILTLNHFISIYIYILSWYDLCLSYYQRFVFCVSSFVHILSRKTSREHPCYTSIFVGCFYWILNQTPVFVPCW